MNALRRGIKLLHSGAYTCILCDRDRVLTNQKRGVAPLLEWLDAGENMRGAAVADRVIGRAAALLLLCGGVSAVYGEVMSAPARGLLRDAGVEAEFGVLVKAIRNRSNTGLCPMEQAVAGIADPALAPAALRAALERQRTAAPI